MDRAIASALREKYAEIRALRLADAAGATFDPRPRMAALASRFPGALRELDQLPPDVIDARIASLDDVLAGGPAAPWMQALARYHELLAAVLRIERALGKRAPLDAARSWASANEPALATLGDDAFAEVVRPAHGRRSRAVLAHVGAELGVPPTKVELLLTRSESGIRSEISERPPAA